MNEHQLHIRTSTWHVNCERCRPELQRMINAGLTGSTLVFKLVW